MKDAPPHSSSSEEAGNVKLYGGFLPFPSQWLTVFAVAQEDIAACIHDSSSLGLTQARFLIETAYHRHHNLIGEITHSLMLNPSTGTAVKTKLENQGLIFVFKGADRRSNVIECTEVGRSSLNLVDDGLRRYQTLIKETLSRKQLDGLLKLTCDEAAAYDALYEDEDTLSNAKNYLSGVSLLLTRVERLAKRYDFTLNEIRILTTVLVFKYPARIATLSSRLGMRPNVVSIVVESLVERGYLTKTVDSEDSRAIRVQFNQRHTEVRENLAAGYKEVFPVLNPALREVPLPVTAHLYKTHSDRDSH